MKSYHRARLKKLRKLLYADARKKTGVKFDLGTWAHPSNDQKNLLESPPGLDCNTTACAIGLACLSGKFKRAGLGFNIHYRTIVPTYKHYTQFQAAEQFFGLTSYQASKLFSNANYPICRGAEAERAVAKRITEFLTGTGVFGPFLEAAWR